MANFWNGRKVLVTGHTGFKGSWLSLWLHSLGAEVTGYALEPAHESGLFARCQGGSWMKSVIGDIRDYPALARTVREARPEVVIHMAAQPLVRQSYRAPAQTYEVNVMGTVHVLEAVREAVQNSTSIRAVVNVTTDKCYENREWHWGYRENDALGGYDPYSNSKACSELVTSAYRSSYFNPENYDRHGVAVATARAGNVIGGGDLSEDRLLPDCIRALQGNQKLRIRSPYATRPWQHVLEPLHGYMLLSQHLTEQGAAAAGAWNFGPDEESVRNVEWIAAKTGELWGDPSFYERDQDAHPHEAADLKLDSSKARRELGWHPRWKVERALEKTVEWFREQGKGLPAKALCLNQIDEYGKDG
ncbi:CDP-glucose 4,6-dehydratase [Paenibacillus pinihumi]|uniref:CDP-glucose 4,6-dehydratase n=1 Tax=Paenibacillus pinihumi TaxID=669462 RepID=UPI0004273AAB|nr:CDP-glucose 4,6-dehydratase [Paenibacillus pinihumi]